MVKNMKLEYFILGLLTLKPHTGYDIKALLDTQGRFARTSTPLSQIYTTLKRMTGDRWVDFEEEKREGKPDLKIYSITPIGEKVIHDWLSAPHKPTFFFQDREFLGKLFFSFLLDKQTVLKHCYTELNYRKIQIEKYRDRDRTLQVAPDSDVPQARAQMISDLLHEYGKGSIDHYVAWLEEFIQQLENLPVENW